MALRVQCYFRHLITRDRLSPINRQVVQLDERENINGSFRNILIRSDMVVNKMFDVRISNLYVEVVYVIYQLA